MKIDLSIEFIPFQRIPAKFPDVLPMDYCAFGLLKITLSKRKPIDINAVWKIKKEK